MPALRLLFGSVFLVLSVAGCATPKSASEGPRLGSERLGTSRALYEGTIRLYLTDGTQLQLHRTQEVGDSLVGQLNGRRTAVAVADVARVEQSQPAMSDGAVVALGALSLATILLVLMMDGLTSIGS